MSSQSRKRFSKILEFNDDYLSPDAKGVKRSFNSLNFLGLKEVDEMPENSYPARFSIPPFSPLKLSPVGGGIEANDVAQLSTPIMNSSETTNPEKSTVESLLDRHIEALGLMPESDDGDSISAKDIAIHFPSGATDDTFKALAASLGRKNLTRTYSLATEPSHVRSSLGSPERRRLMPRRLFASADMSTSKLPSLQSAPQLPGLVPGSMIPDTYSYGWQTLASSSQLASMPSMARAFSDEAFEGKQEAQNDRRFKVRRRSTLSLTPSSHNGWSQSAEDLSRRNQELHVHKRTREDFDRQVSHRRRQRIRLKLKRNSQSLASITGKEIADKIGSVQVVVDENPNAAGEENTPIEPDGPAELDSIPIQGVRNISVSPKIPHRWSSLINVIQQPIKQSIDVVRKPSIRTVRSHPSISSLAEPINSTRFAAQSPNLVSQISISMLAPPDLGPPLHASTLDLSIPYAPEPSTVRPTLRETRSFFSDDSSRFDNKGGTSGGTGTLRKKLGLHSLRNVIPVSPHTSVVPRAFSVKHSGNRLHVHHSCNNIAGGKESFDEEAPLDGTIGMSDFAYRKRRVMQKVKDWWMRQCVQKKLVGTLRRKKDPA
jgi:hypothetical protein